MLVGNGKGDTIDSGLFPGSPKWCVQDTTARYLKTHPSTRNQLCSWEETVIIIVLNQPFIETSFLITANNVQELEP